MNYEMERMTKEAGVSAMNIELKYVPAVGTSLFCTFSYVKGYGIYLFVFLTCIPSVTAEIRIKRTSRGLRLCLYVHVICVRVFPIQLLNQFTYLL
jgi:hypothetical protein